MTFPVAMSRAEKGRGLAVAEVIEAASRQLAGPHWLAAVKRLDLRLLVHTEHDGMPRRDIEADDIAYLGDKIRVGQELDVSIRLGCNPKARQMRWTLEAGTPLSCANSNGPHPLADSQGFLR